MKTLKSWNFAGREGAVVALALEDGREMRFAVLDHDLIRVSIIGAQGWRQGRTWAVAPLEDVPLEGRARESVAGFSCPDFNVGECDDLLIETDALRLRVTRPLALIWSAKIDGAWREFAADRPTGAYLAGRRDHRHHHYMRRQPGERIYGLGEKTGGLERSRRRFEMRNVDAMGYDAELTDPLYKHIPFTLTRTDGAGAWSIYYDTLAPCWFDLGNEIDNYHAPFRAFRAADGDLDYYLRWSPDLAGLVRAQTAMTGGTAFPPRWSLGYSGSTMSYTDAPDAQARLEGFLDRVEAHGLPCDSFQMSSGYTSIGSKRYVFNWNREKFPDMPALAARFAAAGVRLIANIKPCLLRDHPRYAEAEPLFIRDSDTGDPELSAFWDAEGSHLDFTNPATVEWWTSNVTSQLLEHGIDATWNDNNEYEVWDDAARCAGFGAPIEIGLIRPLHAILMTRASREAQIAHAPDRRPYLISRAGAPGLQRYAQTWTGDNRTAWKTLRYNNHMALGLSMSGFYNIGHDVGGFAGPKPEPELFLRWVQNGIFYPRFTIHSWNDDATANEPWMHAEVLPQIHAAFALRYRLLPYLYTALFQAVRDHEPMLRPTFLDHDHDPRCFEESDEFLLGRDLLAASVVEQRAAIRRLWLPENGVGWLDFATGAWFAPGQQITRPVDWDSIPLYVHAGAAIPAATGARRAAPETDQGRELLLFPAPGTFSRTSHLYEDDGLTPDALADDHYLLKIAFCGDDDRLDLSLSASGRARPLWDRLGLILPPGETRPLYVNGAAADCILTADIPHAE